MKKLKSKKGSALLLGMLFSLICIILGIIILSAGVAANGRIVNAAKAEQPYFIVSSLLDLFDHETSAPDTLPDGTPIIVGMQVSLDTDTATIFTGAPNMSSALEPFIASALSDAVRSGISQERTLTYTIGAELGAENTYTATVILTVRAEDYSIYLDVQDIKNGSGESIGVPNLNTIAIQAKSVTPLELGTDAHGQEYWEIVQLAYHRAKYVQKP